MPLPDVSGHTSHVTIALRSVLTKLEDIRSDNNLRCASILCLCETLLNASQPSPVLLDDQVV